MSNFILTHDDVMLTNKGTVATVMVGLNEDTDSLKERLRRYFPVYESITEQCIIETMLMVPIIDGDREGFPLQTLYVTPYTSNEQKHIGFWMRKRAPHGTIVHEDKDDFILTGDTSKYTEEIIDNFIHYYQYCISQRNAVGLPV